MIGYTSLGTNNLRASAAFYDQLLDLLGASRAFEFPDFIVWKTEDSQPMFSVHTPYDKEVATAGNGVMIALKAESTKQVQATYDQAILLGGACEGKPGYRMDGFYAAYFRDLDGNKLNVHFME